MSLKNPAGNQDEKWCNAPKWQEPSLINVPHPHKGNSGMVIGARGAGGLLLKEQIFCEHPHGHHRKQLLPQSSSSGSKVGFFIQRRLFREKQRQKNNNKTVEPYN